MTTYIICDKSILNGTEKDDLLNSIEYWWLELNNEGKPIREIGFNLSERVVYVAPTEYDYGLWSDSNIVINTSDEYRKIQSKEFDYEWNKFLSTKK